MKIATAAAANLPSPAAALSLWGLCEPVAALAENVVAAVLQFGDVREDREDGTTLIRFTRDRLEREDMQLLLGDALYRALDVSLIWDETEDQLVRVLDLAPLRQSDGQRRARASRPNRYADAHMRSFPRKRFSFEPEAA